MPTDMMHSMQMPQAPGFYGYQQFFIITALILYFLAALMYSGFSGSNTKTIAKKIAQAFIIMALFANFAVLIVRYIEGGRLPLNNIFETLSFFTLVTGIIFLLLEFFYKVSDYGVYVLAVIVISLCAVAFGPGFDNERMSIPPSMPALNSYWLPIHVIITFIAYSGFAIAACAGARYLMLLAVTTAVAGPGANEQGMPPQVSHMNTLDEIMYKIIGISYVLLGAGIISGSIWANEAWGGYWMWDPKEVWSLITWAF